METARDAAEAAAEERAAGDEQHAAAAREREALREMEVEAAGARARGEVAAVRSEVRAMGEGCRVQG